MPEDLMRYDQLAQQALKGVVREALRIVERSGLPGEHHFYIAFNTKHPGVNIGERLAQRYPREMTIVLQHQFWGLTVTEDRFEVGLSFGGIPERLVVPFAAIKSFFDPSVQFGLQFEPQEAMETPAAKLPADPPSPSLTATTATPAAEEEPPKGNEGATVVRFDRFRKK